MDEYAPDEFNDPAFNPVEVISETARPTHRQQFERMAAEGFGDTWIMKALERSTILTPCAPSTANRLLTLLKDIAKWVEVWMPKKKGEELNKEHLAGKLGYVFLSVGSV